jgi:hypothetical protein
MMWDVLIFTAIVGLLAELIDASLGMAFGVTSNSLLLTLGLAPAVASATVHTAEIFTTLASGLTHLKLGNVDNGLFKRLVVPGAVTAAIGAYVVVEIPLPLIKLAVTLYLAIMGGIIILRAFGKILVTKKVSKPVLAAVGGFCDAVGGGGWGPIVTSTLIANGENPKKAIGSVNLAEWFVTITQSAVFFALLGVRYPQLVIAFLAGGLIAAPMGSYITKKAPVKILMLVVGFLIICLQVRTILLTYM